MHKIVSYNPLNSNKDILTYFDLDICGPFNINGFKKEHYFITLTCCKTRAIWVYAIKFKSQAFDILIDFYNLIKNQFNINIKAFRLNNAKEFKLDKWTAFIKSKGIIYKYTSPYTPA